MWQGMKVRLIAGYRCPGKSGELGCLSLTMNQTWTLLYAQLSWDPVSHVVGQLVPVSAKNIM